VKQVIFAAVLLAWSCSRGQSPSSSVTEKPVAPSLPQPSVDGVGSSNAGSGSNAAALEPQAMSDGGECSAEKFAESVDLPEASGATPLTIDGKPSLLVISDSGNHGAFAIIDADTGVLIDQGKIPMAATSDDFEGLATSDGVVFGITSAGWIYRWKLTAHGTGDGRFEMVGQPYSLGAPDTTWRKNGGLGDKPPVGEAMACVADGTNCGRNYEGICILPKLAAAKTPNPKTEPPCVGLAVAKADGHAYCLTYADGKLTANYARRFAVARPGGLSDCSIDDRNRMVIGANLFDSSNIYTVEDWQSWRLTDASTAPKISKRIGVGVGFSEVLTAGPGDVIYRMSDASGAPSLMAKFRCSDKTK
jgi:hypothetical protein